MGILLLLATGGCSENCCTFDSRPIPLSRASSGELLVRTSLSGFPASAAALAVFDPGSPLTFVNAPGTPPRVRTQEIRLMGPPAPASADPLRAVFRGVQTIETALAPLGTDDPFIPLAVLGGDLLTSLSIEIGFRAPELTIWSKQPVSTTFLSEWGYAVFRMNRTGAGELNVRDGPGLIGQRPQHQFPASHLVVRACAAPDPFDRLAPLPARCCAGDERKLATGTDLALLVSTGIGPMVIGEMAWQRIKSRLTEAPPEPVLRPLFTPTSTVAQARWTHIPSLALVDREADDARNPGPCVELGRARRLEQVDYLQSQSPMAAACAPPCDQDPTSPGRAQDSSAHLDLNMPIEVVIIADSEPLLQALRADVHPEGPEVDGILGAAALINTRAELDYLGQTSRIIIGCEGSGTEPGCRAVGRCPRLPSRGESHVCFGLESHGLPAMCNNDLSCD